MQEGASTAMPRSFHTLYANIALQSLKAKLNMDWPKQIMYCALLQGHMRPKFSL